MQTIDEGAFLNTVGLKEITIPDGVKTISRFAFEGSGIEKINLPENLEVIGYGAFKSTNLKEVVIPENVNIDEAGQEAGFNNCEQLERVEFKGKTSLQYYEFEGCDNLKEIIFRQGNNIIDARYITSKATIYGLSNSSAYNFANKNGNSFCSIDPPQNRKAEKVDNTTIKLSWTAVSKNASYKVYRSNQILHQLYRYKKGKFKSALNVHKALKIKGMQSSSIEQVYSDGIGFYANNLGKRVLWLYGLKNNKLKLKTKRSIR